MSYSEHKPKHIYRFLQSKYSQGVSFWAKGTNITLEKTGKTVVLEQDVVGRQRKPQKPDEPRFEFVGNKLPSEIQGKQGEVFLVDHTLNPKKFRDVGSDGLGRIIKFLPGSLEDSEAEYQVSAMTDHLHSKPLAHGPRGSALVMDRFRGERLFDIVEYNDQGVRPLDRLGMKKRMELTLALLQAFKEQVSDKGLIHFDLKPENIIVDLYANPIAVNIVDYGSCIPASVPVTRYRGTPLYTSPEVFRQQARDISTKTDIFSLGKIIAHLWGSSSESFGKTPLELRQRIFNNHNLEGLFAGIEDLLQPKDKQAIRATLAMMLHPEANCRLSLDEIFERFQALDLEYATEYLLSISVCDSSSSDDEDSFAAVASSSTDADLSALALKTDTRADEDESSCNVPCCPVM